MAQAPDSGKDLPQSIEAEVSVLGAMLLEPAVIDEVASVVKAESFIRPAHQEIYRALVALHERQQGIDIVPVLEELRRRDRLEAVGGAEYLAYLVDAVPSAANAVHYAEIVREKAMQRAIIQTCNETLAAAYGGRALARDLLDETQGRFFRIAEEGMSRNMLEMREVLKTTFERIDRSRRDGDRYSGLPTTFHDLDQLTSGLQAGELIILAGRPSMGKTTLALNIVERVTTRLGKTAAIFSLEMAAENIARNLLCLHARIDPHKLRSGLLAAEEYPRLSLAVGRLSEANIYIDDTPAITSYEIRAKARMLKARRGLDLIVVDYLQLAGVPPLDSREQQIAHVSRSLKSLARELNVPLLAVSQLNRGPETREEHRPRMSDLRESGSLEQDADVVLLIHRPAQYKWADDRDLSDEDLLAEVQVAKQRNGPTGVVKLTFIRHIMRFEDSAVPSGGPGDTVPL